jgi:hypothetical protein
MGTVHFVALAILLLGIGGLYGSIQLEGRSLISRLGLVLVGPAIGIALWCFWWGT